MEYRKNVTENSSVLCFNFENKSDHIITKRKNVRVDFVVIKPAVVKGKEINISKLICIIRANMNCPT